MPTFTAQCEHCKREFSAVRTKKQGPPRFCSYQCYWDSGGPGQNNPNKDRKRSSGRRQVYIGRFNGRPRYIQESHFVWDMTRPDDPIQAGEYIHHADHDSLNNAPANLVKMRASDHQRHHAELIGSSERSRRMRAYHEANPGRQRAGTPRICAVCGREFYRPPSASQVTCSHVCSGKWSAAKRRKNE